MGSGIHIWFWNSAHVKYMGITVIFLYEVAFY